MKQLLIATTGSNYGMNIVNKAFNNIINNAETGDYNLADDTWYENIEYLLEDIVSEIKNLMTCTYEVASQLVYWDVKLFSDMTTAKDQILNTIKSASKKVKSIFIVEEKKSTGKNILKKYNGMFNVKNIDLYQDIADYSDESKYRIYVVRMNDGSLTPEAYVVINPDEKIIRAEPDFVKANYAIDNDANYYNTRPILYKNWIELDAYHQQQTI